MDISEFVTKIDYSAFSNSEMEYVLGMGGDKWHKSRTWVSGKQEDWIREDGNAIASYDGETPSMMFVQKKQTKKIENRKLMIRRLVITKDYIIIMRAWKTRLAKYSEDNNIIG